MVRLTEDMIVARTRVSDMAHVKKLNCWGAELTDVSVLRKLINVEVLSLSVNCISTLEDISYCKNLQELYIRKNKVPDISEICWLKDLSKLRNLWVEENPCSEGGADLYRLTVIKTLPQLQKLDNSQVTSEEMAEAMRRGLDLIHPLDGGGAPGFMEERRTSRVQEERVDERKVSRGQYYAAEQEYEHSARRESVQSPSRRVSNQVFEESRLTYSQSRNSFFAEEEVEEREVRRSASVQDMSPMRRTGEDDLRRMSIREEGSRYSEEGYNPLRSHSESRGPYYEARGPYNEARGPYGSQQEFSRSAQQVEEGTGPHEEARGGAPLESAPLARPARVRGSPLEGRSLLSSLEAAEDRPSPHEAEELRPGSSQMSPSEMHAVVHQHYSNTYRQVDQQLESAQQLLAQGRSASPQHRPYPARPKNRNSNVLSAILCLIKEIDGPSLEVVEMAVRCRMEELED